MNHVHFCDQSLQFLGGSGFNLYRDCFYTSSKMADELLKIRIHLAGTVKKEQERSTTSTQRECK
jgi:hypothetical protein